MYQRMFTVTVRQPAVHDDGVRRAASKKELRRERALNAVLQALFVAFCAVGAICFVVVHAA